MNPVVIHENYVGNSEMGIARHASDGMMRESTERESRIITGILCQSWVTHLNSVVSHLQHSNVSWLPRILFPIKFLRFPCLMPFAVGGYRNEKQGMTL